MYMYILYITSQGIVNGLHGAYASPLSALHPKPRQKSPWSDFHGLCRI